MAQSQVPPTRVTTFRRSYINCPPGVRPGRQIMDKKTISRQAFGMAPIYTAVKITGTL
jgi:hypothetical protein